MAKFKDLSKSTVKEREQATSAYWNEIDLLHRSVEERPRDNRYIFYDGPPTANGTPGIHHVISRTLKDMTCRYKTMKGYRVNRKAGWDTHGLPVEIEVEKKLGLSSKKEIEEYGVEKFNQECRNSVFTYEKQWREMSERMAFLADMDNPYVTLNNDYIESVWWLLDNMFKKGLIYEGAKILPYCSRCGTGLASHEVALGYEMIKTDTVYVKFKKKDEDAYFLAWTTTPWTLPSNVGLTVHPELDYVKVKANDEVYYLAEALLHNVLGHEGEDYEILERMKGKDLEYMEYEQLLPFFPVNKKAFFVVLADYVTTSDGTGIVHTAPAFGEEDYQTGRRYDFPLINPVNEEGKFDGGEWDGMFVMDADPHIIQYLRENGKLLRKQKVEHNYPHCWRCTTPLIYYSKPSWYIEVTKLKEQLIENNNGVNWFPDFIGEKRFGNWLENLNDWAISRSRYWGTPFPVWKCEECGETTSIGSREELVKRAIEEIDESIELHRPYVDDVHLTCSCGGRMTREKDVIDVWFDSGAMPFAQHHWPFENAENFDELYPADFINEGIDQTRGWFYSLIAISTLTTGKSPYKNVLVNDLILDKEGKKMSKSRGNTLNPIELFDEYGADVVRFYSIFVSPPWVPTRFDVDGLREADSKFFRSLRNVYNFFQLYANTDGVDPRDFDVPVEKRAEIDRWILSRYHSLVQNYHRDMDIFEYTKTIRAISDFVIEDVSNWYIRRNRRRFWKTELDEDKKAVYGTTFEILVGVSKLIAPFTPFISEELYNVLVGGESVHLELLPEADPALIDNKLEEKMELVRKLVTLGRASREKVQIKVRQPLQDIVVDGKYEELIGDLVPLMKEELNIKDVIFENDLSEFMDYSLKPNFREAGKVLGKKIKAFGAYLAEANPLELLGEFQKGPIQLELGGEQTQIPEEYVEIRVNAKEGFDVSMEGNVFVILDTTLTPELLSEGYAREFISKIQQMRKNSGFEVADHIRVEFSFGPEVQAAIEEHDAFIRTEILAEEMRFVQGRTGEEVDLNGQKGVIALARV
ncbi:MAG: isoleucine--tRNA ligase [Tissierellia bacterium]|nr:isoleucine--tRNA ligase [Tissierellia bacterium]